MPCLVVAKGDCSQRVGTTSAYQECPALACRPGVLVLLWLAGLLAGPGLRAQPAAGLASLSGTVRDSLTRQPLPFASVFLANTTRGTTADAQGHYALSGVPAGSYELAATFLGYQLRQRALQLPAGATQADLSLPPAAQALGEVVVRPNPHRETDYQRFLELFLGTSSRARQCRVLNPDAVLIDYDPVQKLLTASVPHALEVDNPMLGYHLTFHDLRFQASFAEQGQTVTTLSHLAFRELPGGAGQQRRWATHRQQAYAGSYMHFLRCTYAGTVAEAGFEVRRLRRVPNRRRAAADSLLRARQRELGAAFRQASVPDSVWQLLHQPRQVTYLYQPLLPAGSFRQAADGRVWLRFSDLLDVTYPRARPDAYYQPGVPGRARTSVLHLQETAAELTPLGTTAEPLSVLLEGYWGFEQMGDLLPLDYEPPAAQ